MSLNASICESKGANITTCLSSETELEISLRIVHAACSLILSITGTTGNVISMILICKARLFRSAPIIMLLMDMCVANMLTTAIIQPMVSASNVYGQWLFNEAICQVFAYIMYVALTTECLILMNITICQYLVVVHQVSSGVITRHHKCLRISILLGLPWVLTTTAFLVPLTKLYDEFGYDHRKGFCTLLNRHNSYGFQAGITIALFCIMTTLTFYCYSAILYVHYRSHRKFINGAQHGSTRSKLRRKNAQLIKMITAIFLNYIITYLPFMITNAVDPRIQRTPMGLYIAIIYLSWSHTAINPVIYALMNTKIRAQWCKVFTGCKPLMASKSMSTLTIDEVRDKTDEISGNF